MTLAEKAREAVRARPFVHEGLRAGVINYSAAARLLDVGDQETVAAALRRYAGELPEREPPDRTAHVTMQSGFGQDNSETGILSVGEATFCQDAGTLTGVLVTGDVDGALLTRTLARLEIEGVTVEAAGVAAEHLVTLVPRRDGPRTVEVLEATV